MSLNFSILWTKIIIYMKTFRNSDWLRAVRLIPKGTNFYYHYFAGKTISRTLNKYRIRNFQTNDVIVFSISVLNSFQFRLLCQANIKTFIKRNWKEFDDLGKNYFGSIIYFPKIFLYSIMFQVMLVILLKNITGWGFLPRIEIMISLVVHVLKLSKVPGGTIDVMTPT